MFTHGQNQLCRGAVIEVAATGFGSFDGFDGFDKLSRRKLSRRKLSRRCLSLPPLPEPAEGSDLAIRCARTR
ncbi:MAG: hypothetical protein ACUVR3_00720 [Candidatus Roseilinea sp.]